MHYPRQSPSKLGRDLFVGHLAQNLPCLQMVAGVLGLRSSCYADGYGLAGGRDGTKHRLSPCSADHPRIDLGLARRDSVERGHPRIV